MTSFTTTVVSDGPTLAAMLNSVAALPKFPPSLFLDLEGINLCRHGTISIISLFVAPFDAVYIVDITTLGAKAFTTATTAAHVGSATLQTILEDPTVPKVFFDVRNDSDALFSLYGVRLAGVEDVQLMEIAGRVPIRRQYLAGLAKLMLKSNIVSRSEANDWLLVKDAGLKLFAPEKGGSFVVFDARPLRPEIEAYCANDVRYLPRLHARYWNGLNGAWKYKVVAEAARRVAESQGPGYNPRGPDKAKGPPGWCYQGSSAGQQ